jgi:hypothetical protein
MAEITNEQLIEKANAMLKLAAEAAKEIDPDKAKENAEKLLAMGRELEKMGEEMQAQYKAQAKIARITVVLTPDQRKRIFAKHGIQMETVVIDDNAGAMNQSMPSTRPEQIEAIAMKEAEGRKHAAEADRLVRAELDRAMADIEAQGNADLSAQLEKLKQDPNFAGGLLHKKK